MRRQIFATYTGWIILINVIFYLILKIIFPNTSEVIGNVVYSVTNPWIKANIAIMPSMILSGQKLWTFITSMFMHANLTHLFVNMISLLFIGSFVERLIGKKRFFWFYLIAGLVAGLTFVLLAGFFGGSVWGEKIFGSPFAYAVGASGAIFGLGGLLAVLTPRLKVLVFFIIPMPMWAAMVGLGGILWIASLALPIGIGNTAHLGGLLAGLAYGFYLRYKYPHRTKMISRYFSR